VEAEAAEAAEARGLHRERAADVIRHGDTVEANDAGDVARADGRSPSRAAASEDSPRPVAVAERYGLVTDLGRHRARGSPAAARCDDDDRRKRGGSG
jgi:hypothetical protein